MVLFLEFYIIFYVLYIQYKRANASIQWLVMSIKVLQLILYYRCWHASSVLTVLRYT